MPDELHHRIPLEVEHSQIFHGWYHIRNDRIVDTIMLYIQSLRWAEKAGYEIKTWWPCHILQPRLMMFHPGVKSDVTQHMRGHTWMLGHFKTWRMSSAVSRWLFASSRVVKWSRWLMFSTFRMKFLLRFSVSSCETMCYNLHMQGFFPQRCVGFWKILSDALCMETHDTQTNAFVVLAIVVSQENAKFYYFTRWRDKIVGEQSILDVKNMGGWDWYRDYNYILSCEREASKGEQEH